MIQGTSLEMLRLMEFFTLTSNINDYLAAENKEALNIQEMYATGYLPAFTTFDEALKPFRKTGHTQILLELDARRDTALLGLAKIACAKANCQTTQSSRKRKRKKTKSAKLLIRTLRNRRRPIQTTILRNQSNL